MSDVINTEIIIVGGGIGGLAAALALANIDKHVCVLEQAAEIAEIGAGIQLGPNVYKMFERLGLVDEINSISSFPESLMMRDSMTGESVIEIPAGKQFKQQFGFPYAVIHRADLHGVLLKKCQTSDKIELRTGAKVTGIEESDTGTSVTTEQGLRVNGDALVGADGIWSTIRQHVVGDGDARVSGHVAYRAVIRAEDMPEALRWNSMCLWAGEKSHLVQYPMRGGELFNLVAVFHSDKFTQGWNDFGDNEELEHRFAGKCPEVLSLIGKIESWRMWVLSDREPTRDWVKGRITLLGDAAHPMLQYLAQGANMAIEDAICLADMLVNENGDYAKAFIRYRDARYLRTTRVQMQARLYGEIYHASGAVRDFRNDELASWSDEKFYTGMSWLYDIKPSWRDQ
ncbi:3-hydroxybenzoate 6-monooxygenase [Candidatus Thalassolituus haligoni]|jgi:salicylate hydroxylase|uniref:3-hydroxybenzoate 6-monooxygenase n=1 Tax=Candidatus Thalassolituus haligoni TaxID=3100113 RepID=UPI0035152246|tara:strand:- start:16291 stop:17487 length:1197 start_codon:yes stop_codon:yes gene_type:complete